MIDNIKKIYYMIIKKFHIEKYMPIFWYLFFGGVTTVINIVIYALLARVFKIDYMVSNIIAWLITIIVAYITNRVYVFESSAANKKEVIKEFAKFIVVRVLSLFIDVLVMYIGISMLMIDDLIMKIISNVIVIVTNYFMSKYIVFKKSNK